MLVFQIPQVWTKSKHYWRNLSVVVAFAIIITIVLTVQIASLTRAYNIDNSDSDRYSPGSHTQTVLSGQILLNPNGYYLTGFNVPDEAKNAVLQGNYAVANNCNETNRATMTIWTQQEFLNYFACKNAIPCYNKDMIGMHSDNLNLTLSNGNYLILIHGAGSNTEILQTDIELNFTT